MTEPTPFSQGLYKQLERLEAIVLAAVIVAVAAHYLGLTSSVTVIVMGLAVLAGIYFLTAFRPQPVPSAGTKMQFMDLLNMTILPKVLWISSAVGASGLALFHADPERPGYKQLLIIQTLTALVAFVIWGFGNMQGIQSIQRLTPAILRAVPLMLAGAYILLQ